MPKASDIMTKEVITVTRDISIRDLAEILLQKNINGNHIVPSPAGIFGVAWN